MNCRNRLWKASKYKKKSLTRCSDIRVLNPDGTLKEIIPVLSLPKYKPKQVVSEELDCILELNERRSPRYIEWHDSIVKRDKKTCVLCGAREWIQVHHIKRWVDDEKSRYEQKNGVCLCITCHVKHHGPYGARFPQEVTNRLLHYIDSLVNKE